MVNDEDRLMPRFISFEDSNTANKLKSLASMYSLGIDYDSNPLPDSRFPTSSTSDQRKRAGAALKTVDNYKDKIIEKGTDRDIEDLKEILNDEDQGFLGGAMDLLSIGNHTVAGFTDELLRTGKVKEAFYQAGREFSNALPGYKNDDARRVTFADVIESADKWQATTFDGDPLLESEFSRRYAAPITGFVLDVLIDPLNFIPGVNVINAGKKLNRGRKLAQNIVRKAETGPGGDYVTKSVDFFTKIFKADGDIQNIARAHRTGKDKFASQRKSKGEKDRNVSIEEREKYFIDRLEGEGTEFGEAISMRKRDAAATFLGLANDVRDKARRLIANLSREENLALVFALDSPETLNRMFKEYATTHGDVAVDELRKKADFIRGEYDEFFKQEVQLGIINPYSIREWYVHNSMPSTKGSRSASDEASKRVSEEFDVDYRSVDEVTGEISGDASAFNREGQFKPGLMKVFKSTMERVMAAFPLEASIGKAYAARGFFNSKAITSNSLIKSVLSDHRVAKKFDGEMSEELRADFAKDGYSVWDIDVGSPDLWIGAAPSKVAPPKGLLPTVEPKGLLPTVDLSLAPKGSPRLAKAGDLYREPEVLNRVRKELGTNTARAGEESNAIRASFDKKTGRLKLSTGARKGDPDAAVKIAKKSREVLDSLPSELREKVSMNTSFERISYVLPTEFKNSIEKMNSIFNDTDEMNTIVKGLQRITGMWKGYATLSPGFHMRNAYSNIFQLWLAGAGKGKYSKNDQSAGMATLAAASFNLNRKKSLLKKEKEKSWGIAGDDDLVPLSKRKKNLASVDVLSKHKLNLKTTYYHRGFKAKMASVKNLTDEELFRELDAQRVLNQGHFSIQEEAMGKSLEDIHMTSVQEKKFRKERKSEIKKDDFLYENKNNPTDADKAMKIWSDTIEEMSDKTSIPGMLSKLGDNVVLSTNRAVGEGIENQFRTMLYLDRRIKGATPEEAGKAVRKYLFDYNELSPFEKKYMRTFIPFYTWQRKNIPLMLQSMVEQPAQFSKVPKLMNAIENMSPDLEDVATPDYFDEINAVRLPFAGQKNVIFEEDDISKERPLFLSPNLPFQDIERIPGTEGSQLSASLNPLIKVGLDWYGYDTFLDREIPDRPATKGIAGAVNRTMANMGWDIDINERTAAAINDALPTVGKAERLLKPSLLSEEADWEKFGYQALSEGAGIKIIPVDETRVRINESYKTRKRMREIMDRIKIREREGKREGK